MAKITIFRNETNSSVKSEELLDEFLSTNHPDKTMIGGEDNNSILLNEEGDILLCMEYVELE